MQMNKKMFRLYKLTGLDQNSTELSILKQLPESLMSLAVDQGCVGSGTPTAIKIFPKNVDKKSCLLESTINRSAVKTEEENVCNSWKDSPSAVVASCSMTLPAVATQTIAEHQPPTSSSSSSESRSASARQGVADGKSSASCVTPPKTAPSLIVPSDWSAPQSKLLSSRVQPVTGLKLSKSRTPSSAPAYDRPQSAAYSSLMPLDQLHRSTLPPSTPCWPTGSPMPRSSSKLLQLTPSTRGGGYDGSNVTLVRLPDLVGSAAAVSGASGVRVKDEPCLPAKSMRKRKLEMSKCFIFHIG